MALFLDESVSVGPSAEVWTSRPGVALSNGLVCSLRRKRLLESHGERESAVLFKSKKGICGRERWSGVECSCMKRSKICGGVANPLLLTSLVSRLGPSWRSDAGRYARPKGEQRQCVVYLAGLGIVPSLNKDPGAATLEPVE
jgi:hypothetical protein